MRRLLSEHRLFSARQNDAEKYVVLTREPVPTTGAELLAAFEEFARTLDPSHRSYGLILDVRNVVGNNNPEFEQSANEIVVRAHRYFKRVVVVLTSAAGALQAKRLNGTRSDKVIVARDMIEAIALATH